jgi:pantoate--beta-alanine ligase
MQILKTKNDLKKIQSKTKLALVPTMGALHEGHLSLVKISQSYAETVIVSIFVNPTQFAPNEDLSKYPRPIEDDIKKLESLNVDFLFLPDASELYPQGLEITHYANKELSQALCGLNRPGHFDGVCTVVYKLFDLIKPDYAIFGQKDYQQLLIIKDLVRTEQIMLEIIEAEIFREADGLAMSSRNVYLNKEERLLAPELNRALKSVAQSKQSIDEAKLELISLGFELDYLETRWNRIFVAAKIGSTRLIDNLALVT